MEKWRKKIRIKNDYEKNENDSIKFSYNVMKKLKEFYWEDINLNEV